MSLLQRISIRGFRSARDVELSPGPLCALVGEAASGKSTVLEAVWALLEVAAPVPTLHDVSRGRRRIHVEAVSGQARIFLDARPPETVNLNRDGAPPAVFLPASLRATEPVAPTTARGDAARVAKLLRGAAARPDRLVDAMERICREQLTGAVLLLEEPELFLSPQSQRSLYRLLHTFAHTGNQVLLSTHSPSFLRVDRLEEIALVRRRAGHGTQLHQPGALPDEQALRALAEFDAERSELFLSRAALLVEGMTEKLALPLVFRALGYDPDREAIAVVECGGKANMPLFARICNAAGIPYVVLHDRDAPAGRRPNESERLVNGQLLELAGEERIAMLVPDFEGVVGLRARNRKPEQAVRRLAAGKRMPPPLADAVERVVAAARG